MLGAGDDVEHGTNVVGIIGAQPFNDKGVLGIAPDAEIIAVECKFACDELTCQCSTASFLSF